MTEIVFAVAGKVSEYLVAPIGRQLGYLFCYRSYTDGLRNNVEKLGKARDDLKISVDEAKRKGEKIRPIVEDWLNRVDQLRGEAEELIKKQNQICLNLKSRYQLGRDATKKARVIVEIQEARNFPDGVSYHAPLRAVTFKEYECYDSRASTLNKIMDALRNDDKMKVIGVWGMGGVGKTTIVKQVAEEAKQQNLFTTQVYVDVSWTREDVKIQQGIQNIQQHIADMLGLKFEEETIPARAGKLMERLKSEKILIILDDLWKEVPLRDVGIPSCNKDCKMVLASRHEYLLRKDMGAQECFPIQYLQEAEAWQLFKKTAGDSVESNLELQPIAREVAKECEGLPIAIVTIAKALKDESVALWRNALDELRNSTPTNIRGVEEKVYGCLEWSYNHLKGDEVRLLFLLCGSLSYGDISMYQLLKYAMGLDMFDRIKSLVQARDKLVTLVTILKASSLLLDGEDHVGRGALLFMDGDNQETVRMHDVVRDVARNIASKHPQHRFLVREDVSLEDWPEIVESKYISLYFNAMLELPQRLVCSKLQFLLMQNNVDDDASLNIPIPNMFFEGMNQLKVLDLSEIDFTTLPSALQSLANLRTLCLDWCQLGDIAGIGELKKLQVLSMAGSSIQQLPKEMVQLTDLRLLDLNNCGQLKVIPRNILSSLSRLECLLMKSSFSQWAVEEVSDRESNACLSELNHLHHLTIIEVEIPDFKLVPEEDLFFQNLTSYAIFIGNIPPHKRTYEKSKTVRLEGDKSLLLRNGIGELLKKTEDLEVRVFEEVFCGPNSIRSFDNLKILNVGDCHGLKFLFVPSMARRLSQLEEMTIASCNAMQQILTYEGESEIQEDDYSGTNLQIFPKLRVLKLDYLSELINFGYLNSQLETTSEGNLDIDMPFFSYEVSFVNLQILEVSSLPKLKEIWNHQLPLDSFSKLRILRVQNCRCLLNLMPYHLMRSFKNLKEIEVMNCRVLQYVFDLQGHDTNVEILPKFKTLKLKGLDDLRGIICNHEKNDSMRCLFSLSTPMSFHNLKYLSIDSCGNKDKDNGNANMPIEDGVLFGENVSFPRLEELHLNHLSMLTMIWHPQFSLKCFSKLRILRVETCPCLVNLVPSHLIESFQNLKKVIVDDCEVLERVFDHEGINGDNRILPKLECLHLWELPKLRLVFCKEDKNDSMRYLLSPFKFKDFHHLEDLSILNCGMLLLDEKVSFSPNLKMLKLENLSALKEIDFGISPKLKTLRLNKLPRLSSIMCNEEKNGIKRTLFSPSTFKNFQSLEELRISNDRMEDERDVYTPEDRGVLSNEKIPFLDGGVRNYEAFESRASTFNKIMDTLRDDNIKSIGVVGIGGVGKTTLIKKLALQAIQHRLFTKQVFIDVSWTLDSNELQRFEIIDIQQRIANALGFSLDIENGSKRAADLMWRLKKGEILIILDDIWKEIDLEEIGIPNSCKHDDENKCKIVFTSRDADLLCKDMGVQICFPVTTLSIEESWTLFKKTAGGDRDCDWVAEENNSENSIRSIAIQVVEECEGLPIAIVAIGKALKNETRLAVWETVLKHLRSCLSREVGKKVVYCLASIYTHFKGRDVKSLLLLSGMLSYFGDISSDSLLQYAVGLDLLGGTDSLEQAGNILLSVSSWLTECYDEFSQGIYVERQPSLLFRSAGHKFVRMQDIFYDVAREIAFKDPHLFLVK